MKIAELITEALLRAFPRVDVHLVRRGERVLLGEHVPVAQAVRLAQGIEQRSQLVGLGDRVFAPPYSIEFSLSATWGWRAYWPYVAAEGAD